MSAEKIDGDEVLLGGVKCVANLAKLIPRFLEILPDHIYQSKKPSPLDVKLVSTNLNNKRVSSTAPF